MKTCWRAVLPIALSVLGACAGESSHGDSDSPSPDRYPADRTFDQPTPLAFGFGYGLAVDGTALYWSDLNGDQSSVKKVSLQGGPPTTLATGPFLGTLTSDAQNIYVVSTHSLLRLPLRGGELATLVARSSDIPSVVSDGSHVYWVEFPGPSFSVPRDDGGTRTVTNKGSVMKVPVGGGTPVTLASEQQGPYAIAVDSHNVYWTNLGDDTVMSVSLDGGSPTLVASEQRNPDDIAVDATSLYWTTDTDVMKAPLEGGPPVRIASSDSIQGSLTVTPTRLHWLTWTSQLVTTTLDGTGQVTLPLDPPASSFVIDDRNVYWVHNYNMFALPSEPSALYARSLP